jgi:hypothetical protein
MRHLYLSREAFVSGISPGTNARPHLYRFDTWCKCGLPTGTKGCFSSSEIFHKCIYSLPHAVDYVEGPGTMVFEPVTLLLFFLAHYMHIPGDKIHSTAVLCCSSNTMED